MILRPAILLLALLGVSVVAALPRTVDVDWSKSGKAAEVLASPGDELLLKKECVTTRIKNAARWAAPKFTGDVLSLDTQQEEHRFYTCTKHVFTAQTLGTVDVVFEKCSSGKECQLKTIPVRVLPDGERRATLSRRRKAKVAREAAAAVAASAPQKAAPAADTSTEASKDTPSSVQAAQAAPKVTQKTTPENAGVPAAMRPRVQQPQKRVTVPPTAAEAVDNSSEGVLTHFGRYLMGWFHGI